MFITYTHAHTHYTRTHTTHTQGFNIVSAVDTATYIGGQSSFTDLSGWDMVRDDQITTD